MNRTQLQQPAEERARDAEALLLAGRWSGAFYLAGYAVECALKACIARRINQHDFPDKDLLLKCYTHKFEVLLDAAELLAERNAERAANAAFDTNWTTLKDWSEQARYRLWTETAARNLYVAVADPADGVFPWIAARW